MMLLPLVGCTVIMSQYHTVVYLTAMVKFINHNSQPSPLPSRAPFTREQFGKGPLLNCTFDRILCERTPIIVLLPKVSCKIFKQLLHFTTMLNLSKGPQLNCCHVNSMTVCTFYLYTRTCPVHTFMYCTHVLHIAYCTHIVLLYNDPIHILCFTQTTNIQF